MHTYTATITPQLHAALIIDYLNPSTTLAEMSRRHAVPLPQLIEWTERENVVELTEAYARASAKRAALLAVIATPSALRSTLVCLDSPNPETARRAAATILRQAQRAEPAPPQPDSASPQRAPQPTPQPAPNTHPAPATPTKAPRPHHRPMSRVCPKRPAHDTAHARPPRRP